MAIVLSWDRRSLRRIFVGIRKYDALSGLLVCLTWFFRAMGVVEPPVLLTRRLSIVDCLWLGSVLGLASSPLFAHGWLSPRNLELCKVVHTKLENGEKTVRTHCYSFIPPVWRKIQDGLDAG